jgi:hypothetical protein
MSGEGGYVDRGGGRRWQREGYKEVVDGQTKDRAL